MQCPTSKRDLDAFLNETNLQIKVQFKSIYYVQLSTFC